MPEGAKIVGGLVGVAAIVAIILIAVSLEKINTGEVGLEYDTVARDLDTSAKGEGLHAGPPGYRFIKFPSTFTGSESSVRCLSRDGLNIELVTAFQFLADRQALHRIAKAYGGFDEWQQVVKLISRSAISTGCSLFTTPQFQADRGNVQNQVLRLLEERLGQIDCIVKDVQIRNVRRPDEYEAVIRSKESAREDIAVAQAERPIALTNANREKEQAATAAQRILQTANSFAKITLDQANNTATAITNAFETEARTYASIKDGQQLTIPGFLSYLAIRAIEEKSDVEVALDEPAQFSFVPDLAQGN